MTHYFKIYVDQGWRAGYLCQPVLITPSPWLHELDCAKSIRWVTCLACLKVLDHLHAFDAEEICPTTGCHAYGTVAAEKGRRICLTCDKRRPMLLKATWQVGSFCMNFTIQPEAGDIVDWYHNRGTLLDVTRSVSDLRAGTLVIRVEKETVGPVPYVLEPVEDPLPPVFIFPDVSGI